LRYLRRDPARQIIETPAELVERVAWAVAAADGLYRPHSEVVRSARRFARLIGQLDFLPNSPALMNAGTPLGQLCACFVLPVEDSLDGIFRSVREAALIQQAAGGTGFSFSRLRPRGDVILSTRRTSSGAVSFVRIFDQATDVITTGGLRRGANMGVLRVDHPDIAEFIRAKADPAALPTFNLSVAVTDAFMRAAAEGGSHELRNPRTGLVTATVDASAVLDDIARHAWANGQPGVLFLDRINRDNPTPQLGAFEATNPCSEQPLLPYEACCLGSINLAHMIRPDGDRAVLDLGRLGRAVRIGVHFLDNAVDVTRYPLPEIEAICLSNRKIGLGVMGFADLLVRLQIPYASDEALRIAHLVMSFVHEKAVATSEALAASRGAFPAYRQSALAEMGAPPLRNATLTTVAPTGSLSILADCSAGIEPLFALAYRRELGNDGAALSFVHPIVQEIAEREGVSIETVLELLETGSSRFSSEIQMLETSHAIPLEWHLRVQAAFQEHVEAGISKTINLPANATVAAVRAAIVMAHRLGLKGITVFRNESRPDQPLKLAGSCLACDTLEHGPPSESS
jgi:ribonucleoside-diphosphate reductase alpha chain